MMVATLKGDLQGLVYALGLKDSDFWTGAEGRKVLRILASITGQTNQKRIASYLILKRHVPLNTVPADELALDKDRPDRQHHNRNMTPLLASTCALKEDFALFVLSLRPEADLHLSDLENDSSHMLEWCA